MCRGLTTQGSTKGYADNCGQRYSPMAQNRSMFPSAPGTYILVLRSYTARAITIGRLGKLRLRSGFYLYIGSAFGPGGLRARIQHHLRRARCPHWHIDYLRRYTQLEAVWYWSGSRREHEAVTVVGGLPGATVALPGFGSSDCECDTHLFWFGESLPKPPTDMLAWNYRRGSRPALH